jgi:hypothetical protein
MLIIGAVLAFLLSFIGLRHLHPGGILFYQGVALALLSAVVVVVLARARQRQPWSAALKDAMLAFLLSYGFLFTIPTTVDRSYSVRLLLRLADAPGGMTRNDIEQFYVRDFIEAGGVDRRLVEQRATGTIREENGRFVLTKEGRAMTDAFRTTCDVFVCQQQRRQ